MEIQSHGIWKETMTWRLNTAPIHFLYPCFFWTILWVLVGAVYTYGVSRYRCIYSSCMPWLSEYYAKNQVNAFLGSLHLQALRFYYVPLQGLLLDTSAIFTCLFHPLTTQIWVQNTWWMQSSTIIPCISRHPWGSATLQQGYWSLLLSGQHR